MRRSTAGISTSDTRPQARQRIWWWGESVKSYRSAPLGEQVQIPVNRAQAHALDPLAGFPKNLLRRGMVFQLLHRFQNHPALDGVTAVFHNSRP